MSKPMVDVEERFWSKIEVGPIEDCWPTTMGRNKGGYPMFAVPDDDGKWQMRYAHHVMREMMDGPVPEGMELDHACHTLECRKVRKECPHLICLNPFHLRVITSRENGLRSANAAGVNARKTHCLRGHEFDRLTKNGWRRCSTCARERGRA